MEVPRCDPAVQEQSLTAQQELAGRKSEHISSPRSPCWRQKEFELLVKPSPSWNCFSAGTSLATAERSAAASGPVSEEQLLAARRAVRSAAEAVARCAAALVDRRDRTAASAVPVWNFSNSPNRTRSASWSCGQNHQRSVRCIRTRDRATPRGKQTLCKGATLSLS